MGPPLREEGGSRNPLCARGQDPGLWKGDQGVPVSRKRVQGAEGKACRYLGEQRLGDDHSKCKGPGAGLCLASLSSSGSVVWPEPPVKEEPAGGSRPRGERASGPWEALQGLVALPGERWGPGAEEGREPTPSFGCTWSTGCRGGSLPTTAPVLGCRLVSSTAPTPLPASREPQARSHTQRAVCVGREVAGQLATRTGTLSQAGPPSPSSVGPADTPGQGLLGVV